MKVLVVGNGGREHALALKMRESNQVSAIYVAEGNAGTAVFANNVLIKAYDIDGLSDFVVDNGIDLVVAGSEVPLSLGLENIVREKARKNGLDVMFFGPSKECALLESSKEFAKDVMKSCGVPTAKYEVFDNYDEAVSYLSSYEGIYDASLLPVIKADGLAAGKGVFLPSSVDEGIANLAYIMKDKVFGKSGSKVVIEERLGGEEISLMAFCDGSSISPCPIAKDHKRLLDGDLGPNTGGMGAFAPHPLYSLPDAQNLVDIAIKPVVNEMSKRGLPYKGILYAGLIMTKDGPKVLEYNCRFGDPETQVVMQLLKSNLVDVLIACDRGTLHDYMPEWRNAAALTVVLANKGYPEGKIEPVELKIDQLEEQDEIKIIHAGTSIEDGVLMATGGRVLCVTACCENKDAAEYAVYSRIKTIDFPHVQYRKDIAR